MGCERREISWPLEADLARPCWDDYRGLFRRLSPTAFPDCAALNELLPPGVASHAGRAIRFHDSDTLDDEPYERRILHSGRVSTRRHDLHDLFNAFVWARFPRLKAAMNVLHCRVRGHPAPGRRGRTRDGLTLFDECGLAVISPDRSFLGDLANFRWRRILHRSSAFHQPRRVTVMVLGHALLEKCVAPYPALTGNCLLLRVHQPFMARSRERQRGNLDAALSRSLLSGDPVLLPHNLSPLPLAAVPDWEPDLQATPAGDPDPRVFRPRRPDRLPAPIYEVSLPSGADSRRNGR